jgi:hypothetical protein
MYAGHLDSSLYQKIVNKVERCTKNKKFYIGKTGRHPQERFNEHLRQNPKWTKMIVLYQSTSKYYVEALENILVEETFRKNKNKASGGGGPLSKKHKHSFVYVLVA